MVNRIITNSKLAVTKLVTPTNIAIIVLAALALVLHFLKITGALKGPLLRFNSNKVGKISGNNNSVTINQSTNTSKKND